MTTAPWIWFDKSVAAATARAAVWPLSFAFRAGVTVRRELYRAGLLTTHASALPCVSVGNLSVGGTGKTPIAAWLAGRLRARARPAIVLRGYGGDEAAVHRRLNPDVPVFVSPDRVAAVREARLAGAQLVILDDAFQHRRIARVADVVLVSVEQYLRPRRLLPAGPWREPVSALRDADLLVLTRKAASPADARDALRRLEDEVRGIPVAVVWLAPQRLERVDGVESLALEALHGAQVMAIAGIGEPDAFRRQLEQLGARTELAAFRDHHSYTHSDVRSLAGRVPKDGFAVCTLKDAVKLSSLWPGPRALWYVSQRLVVEQGADHVDRLCARVLERVAPATAG